MTPLYFHAVTAHLLVLGLILGVGALGLACWLRSRGARLVAVALIGSCAVMAGPIFWAGKTSYKEVRGSVDEQGQAWLDRHLDRGEAVIWGYAVLALVSAGAGMANRREWVGWRGEKGWMLAMGVGTLAMVAAGAWTAQAGGECGTRNSARRSRWWLKRRSMRWSKGRPERWVSMRRSGRDGVFA